MARERWLGPACAALLVPLAVDAQLAAVRRAQKIDDVQGGAPILLHDGDGFGASVAALGDVNGDGVGDLAVGAYLDDDGGAQRGAIWVLFLDATAQAASVAKISQTQGGFSGTLQNRSVFGYSLAALGDLDGDGVPDLAAACAGPSRIWILFLKSDGTVKANREILVTDPAFVPATSAATFVGGSLCNAGDLDGDGVVDLVFGAPYDDDGAADDGAAWILHLNADGSLKSTHKISQTSGGLGGILTDSAQFGGSVVALGDVNSDGTRDLGVEAVRMGFSGVFFTLFLDASENVLGTSAFEGDDFPINFGALGEQFAALGDLDGDGVTELAAGFPFEGVTGGPPPNARGAVAISFLHSDGSLKKRLMLAHELNGMGPLPDHSAFGSALASLGDLDGDGGIELAAGALDDGPSDRGAVWILSLAGSATRNGSGVNPLTLTQTSEPLIGQTWNATLDCSGHANGIALVAGYDRPLGGVLLPQGELLVDALAGQHVFTLLGPHSGALVGFSTPIPNDAALIDLRVYAQGLCSGAPGIHLGNALDLVVGR